MFIKNNPIKRICLFKTRCSISLILSLINLNINLIEKKVNGIDMNIYFELMQKPVFTMEYVRHYYDNLNSAQSAVKRLMKQGLVTKIRKNMYTCISGETNAPLANQFQIACAITPTAYLSHHTAMEYHGLSDQLFFDVYVSSDSKFNSFEFDGYRFQYVASRCNDGIINVQYSGGICVTDRERTLIDSVKDLDKISGLEEVAASIEMYPKLNEKLLLTYLKKYQCTSQQKVDTVSFYLLVIFLHDTLDIVWASDNSKSMQDVLR